MNSSISFIVLKSIPVSCSYVSFIDTYKLTIIWESIPNPVQGVLDLPGSIKSMYSLVSGF